MTRLAATFSNLSNRIGTLATTLMLWQTKLRQPRCLTEIHFNAMTQMGTVMVPRKPAHDWRPKPNPPLRYPEVK